MTAPRKTFVRCPRCFNDAAIKEKWGWPVTEEDFWVPATHQYQNQPKTCKKHYDELAETIKCIIASCKPHK